MWIHAAALQAALVVLLAVVLQPANGQDLPHVTECNFCQACFYTKDKAPNARPTAPSATASMDTPTATVQALAAGMVPDLAKRKARLALRNCTECWGCNTRLEPLHSNSHVSAFGANFKVETGASSEWLFHADLPDSHITGKRAIVKVWCVPINKGTGAYMPNVCPGSDLATQGAQHLVALDKLTRECGLQDIAIRVWLAPVHAIIPGTGVYIWWTALWMERAPGLSLNQMAYVGRRDLVKRVVLGLLQEKLNKTQVVRAALYDLITSQCDRHSQNMFVDEHGNIKLIDNLNSLKLSWRHCSVDSLLLPGTQKNEVVRFGFGLVSKHPRAKLRDFVNPMILFDYRCYVPGGELGTSNLPADVKKCLTRVAGMTAEEVMREYGFTSTATSHVLLQRAKDITTKGFEWTLKTGEPVNFPPMRYKWHPPCCKLKLNEKNKIVCGHDWSPNLALPKGDMTTGGAWSRPYPDPGTYDGARLWQELT